MRDQKVGGQQLRVRAGVRNLVDLENHGDFIRSAVSYIDPSGEPIYNTRYLDQRTAEFSMTVNF